MVVLVLRLALFRHLLVVMVVAQLMVAVVAVVAVVGVVTTLAVVALELLTKDSMAEVVVRILAVAAAVRVH